MIRLSEYLITPGDIARAFRWRYIFGIIAGIGVIVGLRYTGTGLDVALFVSAIIATIIWRMDARIPFGAAIACFVAIMIASMVAPGSTTNNQGSMREHLAVAAFYCLVIGIALLIREQVAETKRPVAAFAGIPSGRLPAPHTNTVNTAPKAHAPPAHAPASIHIPAPASEPVYKPHLAPHPALRHTSSNNTVQDGTQYHHAAHPRPRNIDGVVRWRAPLNAHAPIPAPTPSSGPSHIAGHQPKRRKLIQL